MDCSWRRLHLEPGRGEGAHKHHRFGVLADVDKAAGAGKPGPKLANVQVAVLVRLGEPQRYADLDLSHPIVGKLIRQRLGTERDGTAALYRSGDGVRWVPTDLDLSELDEDAIKEAKERLITELSEFLALSEEQLSKLKPVLEESMTEMTEMIEALAKKGSDGWDEFKKQYQSLTDELKKKLEETLDNQQMERFEEYKQDKQDKIQMALAAALTVASGNRSTCAPMRLANTTTAIAGMMRFTRRT